MVTGGREPDMPPSSAVNTPDVQTLFNVIRDVCAFTAFSCTHSAR